MYVSEMIRCEHDRVVKEIAELKEQLRLLPEGTMKTYRCDNRWKRRYYYRITDEDQDLSDDRNQEDGQTTRARLTQEDGQTTRARLTQEEGQTTRAHLTQENGQASNINLILAERNVLSDGQIQEDIKITDRDSAKKWRWLKSGETLLAEKLAEKNYIQTLIAIKTKQAKAMEQFIELYPACYTDFDLSTVSEGDRELLKRKNSAWVKATEEWQKQYFEQKHDYPEQLKVPTKAGIMVRSKSEAMIANSLFDNHIPFHYEIEWKIGDVRINPDFTILHPGNHQIYIWEHFGMMNNKKYIQNTRQKLNTYLDNEIIPLVNLITTYEDNANPLDIKRVCFEIHHHFA